MTAVLDFMQGLSPMMQALLGTLFTWFMTALGAATIFLSAAPPASCRTACSASPPAS
jgi:zinc transporter ZupT